VNNNGSNTNINDNGTNTTAADSLMRFTLEPAGNVTSSTRGGMDG